MIQPNSQAASFAYWMLNISKQRLSTPQRIIVQNVYNAAIANNPISNQEWYNFNLFAAWRNKYFIVYNSYASETLPSLLTSLAASFSFNGNSNDDLGIRNGTDTAMIYGVPYGKVNQGAFFNATNSQITHSALNLGSSWSVAFWIYPQTQVVSMPAIWMTNGGAYAIIFNSVTSKMQIASSGQIDIGPVLIYNTYTHIVITFTSGTYRIYVNGILYPTPLTHTNISTLNLIGRNSFQGSFRGYLDILCAWSRVITQQEVDALYNAYAGIEYPF